MTYQSRAISSLKSMCSTTCIKTSVKVLNSMNITKTNFDENVPPIMHITKPLNRKEKCIGRMRMYGKSIMLPILGFCSTFHFLLQKNEKHWQTKNTAAKLQALLIEQFLLLLIDHSPQEYLDFSSSSAPQLCILLYYS